MNRFYTHGRFPLKNSSTLYGLSSFSCSLGTQGQKKSNNNILITIYCIPWYFTVWAVNYKTAAYLLLPFRFFAVALRCPALAIYKDSITTKHLRHGSVISLVGVNAD